MNSHIPFINNTVSYTLKGINKAFKKSKHKLFLVNIIAACTVKTKLYKYLFPKSNVKIEYHGYFEDLI